MTTKELDNLISFKMGLPSLYHIMLGMTIEETNEYEMEIGKRQTDNYDLNDFLKQYEITVERTAFTSEMCLSEITVYIPLENVKERDLKVLFDYFAFRMEVIEKRFNYSSNAIDEICDLDILIHSELYDVRISINEDSDQLAISFVPGEDVNIDIFRCLAIIANNERQFAKEIIEYVEKYPL